ncbi:putative uncharacterized protein [Waddlia chondrophila 2032/99]|uniref:Secreted protein n=2 Tax=Waddlia chondrophila TaxID=71667 RepID=D6YWC9_WADCW|nr:hypothetical protein [Waddlia chondrophila]ADI38440.1 conserved hypothetical protein [Waddlia chondrophila WSU 86-1044]CCB91526.1 putative uncharacterized protein [Waddlia chondrophila 2032/99]
MRKILSFFLSIQLLCASQIFAQMTDNSKFYPNPGIVAQRGGSWVGSDHLYNLTSNIDILVEIFKPKNIDIPISEEIIRSKVADIFTKGGITPTAEEVPGEPPLPFFHLLIMIYPIEKGYVAYCEGRLFEKVSLERIKLDDQTVLQGVTWESQNLIVSPSDQIAEQIIKSVNEIAETFVERYRFYDEIRRKIQKN